MTVKELIAELSKWPQGLEVNIEGYAAGIETENRSYEPTTIDAWRNEDGDVGVTLWARQCEPLAT